MKLNLGSRSGLSQKRRAFYRHTCLCLGPGTIIEMDDEIGFSLRPEEGWVAGVDKERSVQQTQVVHRLRQLVWEAVKHSV